MEEAAKELRKMGTENVVITGGHLEEEALDLYYDGINFFRLASSKKEGEYHGTSSKPSNWMRTQLYMMDWYRRWSTPATPPKAAASN